MMRRRRLRISGLVQGVGMRPFLWRLAQRHRLAGWVENDPSGVTVEVEGPADSIERFLRDIRSEAPPLARVDSIVPLVVPLLETALPPAVDSSNEQSQRPQFSIRTSHGFARTSTDVPVDVAPCRRCLAEMRDPRNRRHGYPFINCTDCGPRFTILTGLPYDRPQTTMAGFPMCPACDKEYNNPADRRFHAQPIACPDCGPTIWYTTHDSNRHLQVSRPQTGLLSSAAITAAQQHLHEGRLVAVKGVGGFHLACDATHPEAVATLRRRKQRPRKPFAVMVPTVAAAAALAEVNEQAAAFLSSPARPIVLLPKRCPQAVTLAECVAPESPFLGVMLPSSPLHELLFQQSAAADNTSSLQVLVMTSGNFAGEPITTDNMLAAERLGSIADGFLMHDRPIHAACDDSVVRCVAGLPMPIRLARGHAPRTLRLPDEGPCVLAVGGDLKATLCLASGQQAILSQHLGDQASPATLELFTTTARQLLALTHATPERVVADLHPGSLSTHWARAFADEHGLPLVQVQHHQSHAAALLAEHGRGLDSEQPTLVACFDGTGYGEDGSSLGSEFLLAHAGSITRVAHLERFPMPGGDAAVHQPWRLAVGLLQACGVAPASVWPAGHQPTTASRLHAVERQLAAGVACPLSSSMGRLFDAVASLAGLCHDVSFEAEAAVRLEAAADEQQHPTTPLTPYAFDTQLAPDPGEPLPIGWRRLIRQVCLDLARGAPAACVALGFHEAVVQLICSLARQVRDRLAASDPTSPRLQIGLTGGVFQNRLLCERTIAVLSDEGFETLLPSRLPANDGGLAFGQAILGRRPLPGD